jgi:HD-GYP domain-containing protein (c-di-GMP phosphodiesterase class II)
MRRSTSLVPLIPIVQHHHEHFDGSGYPAGLASTEIPIEARIVAVADAIEAMASDRPYRKALPHDKIIAELIRYSGTQFDPQAVNAALKIIETEGENMVVNVGRFSKLNEPLKLSVPIMASE